MLIQGTNSLKQRKKEYTDDSTLGKCDIPRLYKNSTKQLYTRG